jgi:D-3-phosphoglycerate dehydrogenase / 2-oxoglutarate reductase
MKKVLITTVPFGKKDKSSIEMLESEGIEYVINPLNRKLTEEELAELVTDFDAIIAGTEVISDFVMSRARRLKLISRVGIGLDSVDLLAAKRRGIAVSYTPDAPAPAVSELTIGLMLSLLRFTHLSNNDIHLGEWKRYFGRRLEELTIGIIGFGRIGKGVLRHLEGFSCKKILINDIIDKPIINSTLEVEWTEKEKIYSQADVITLHVPLTDRTKSMINKKELLIMKKDATIINTSRGGIIDEDDLFEVLEKNHLSGVAIDAFQQEPYQGPLNKIERCLLTAHMGSMSIDCRTRMEIEATEEVVRFFTNKTLLGVVPEEEYAVQGVS